MSNSKIIGGFVMRRKVAIFFLLPFLSFLFSITSVFADTNWTLTGTNIYNTNTGNIGIGTNAPLSKLAIVGNGTANTLSVNTGGAGANLNIKYGGDNEKVAIGSWSVGGIHFYSTCCGFTDPSNGAVQIYPRTGNLIARGNVAIGTTSLSEKLHVAGNIKLDGSGTPVSSFINFNNNDILKYNDTDNLWTFSSDGGVNFSIRNDNVGIGTANPTKKLQIQGTGSNNSLFLSSNGNFDGGQIEWRNNQSRHWNIDQYNSQLRFFTENSSDGDGIPRVAIDENGTFRIDGTLKAKEIVVQTNVWSDFVFEDDYKLRSLNEVENYINENNHLPDIPSAKEVEESGVSLGSMDSKLLQKVEELTLYTINLEKRIKELENK